MRRGVVACLLVPVLFGTSACAPVRPVERPPAGLFVAFPGAPKTEAPSLQWTYVILLNPPLSAISSLKLSCDGIPESNVLVQGDDIKPGEMGAAVFHGPIVPMSKETTPWVYADTPTHTVCSAVISRAGKPDFVRQISMTFGGKASAQSQSDMNRELAKMMEETAKKRQFHWSDMLK